MRADKFENASVACFEEHPGLYVHPDRVREWLPDLPTEIGLSLLKCERLVPRLSLLIKQHYQLSALEREDDLDLRIAMLDFNSLAEVSQLAGTIFHGRQIRTLILKTVIAELLDGLDERAYDLAVTHADLAPPLPENNGAAPLPTKELIVRDGSLCFRAWLNGLSAPVARRVALKFPSDFKCEPLSSEFELHGSDIVRASGKEFLDHVRR